VLYKFGFRLTSHLEPVKVGSIELNASQAVAQIFLDNKQQNPKFVNGRFVMTNITPGTHSLLVSKENAWPWAKIIAVHPNTVSRFYTFMFPMDGLSVKTILPNDSDFSKARDALKFSKLPEPKLGSSPLLPENSLKEWLELNVPDRKISADKTTALFVEDNTIYVSWISESEPPPHYFCEENPCKLRMAVTVSNQPIKSVDFYKGRNDLILFASGGALYAIEVDREGTQNFQPLYKGTDPYFAQTPAGVLYIKDGGSFLSATL